MKTLGHTLFKLSFLWILLTIPSLGFALTVQGLSSSSNSSGALFQQNPGEQICGTVEKVEERSYFYILHIKDGPRVTASKLVVSKDHPFLKVGSSVCLLGERFEEDEQRYKLVRFQP